MATGWGEADGLSSWFNDLIKHNAHIKPLGMPIVKKLDVNLWEVRSHITDKKIARVIFTVYRSTMVLLHGFIKKSQKTPKSELELAKKRLNDILNQEYV